MKQLLSIIGLLLPSLLFAQHSIWLTDGSKIETTRYQLEEENSIVFYKNKHDRTRSLMRQDIFSITSEGTEIVYYQPVEDSVDFSVPQMRSYLEGKVDAQNNYRSVGAVVSGAIVGFATPMAVPTIALSSLLAPIFPLAQNATVAVWKLNDKKLALNDEQKANRPYVLGYKEEANRKRIKTSLAATGIGIVAGIATAILIQQ